MKQKLICTGTTGALIEESLKKKLSEEKKSTLTKTITKLKSGPLGGDQQLESLIVEAKVDAVIFLWYPMQAQPHDVDVKALLRIAVVYNVPMACNRSTADFLISSPLLNEPYQPVIKIAQYILTDQFNANDGLKSESYLYIAATDHSPLDFLF